MLSTAFNGCSTRLSTAFDRCPTMLSTAFNGYQTSALVDNGYLIKAAYADFMLLTNFEKPHQATVF
eukprot:gene6265-12684_t